MSQDKAFEFIQMVRQDEALAGKLRGDKPLDQADMGDVVSAAAEMGYEFSADDLMAAFKNYVAQHFADLGPQELEDVIVRIC